MKIEPGAPNDLVIKREKAIEYLKERKIWRGDPQCSHEWYHDHDAQRIAVRAALAAPNERRVGHRINHRRERWNEEQDERNSRCWRHHKGRFLCG